MDKYGFEPVNRNTAEELRNEFHWIDFLFGGALGFVAGILVMILTAFQ